MRNIVACSEVMLIVLTFWHNKTAVASLSLVWSTGKFEIAFCMVTGWKCIISIWRLLLQGESGPQRFFFCYLMKKWKKKKEKEILKVDTRKGREEFISLLDNNLFFWGLESIKLCTLIGWPEVWNRYLNSGPPNGSMLTEKQQ